MYFTLIVIHNLFRWVALFAVILSTFVAIRGYKRGLVFTSRDNVLRHWSATLIHIQLTIGFLLYFVSPIVNSYWKQAPAERELHDGGFFAVVHIAMMFVAVILITLGSALSKRAKTDREKFRTIAVYYAIALLLILVAIPWSFSPLASRPLLRTF